MTGYPRLALCWFIAAILSSCASPAFTLTPSPADSTWARMPTRTTVPPTRALTPTRVNPTRAPTFTPSHTPTPSPTAVISTQPPSETATVVRVMDGDTIEVSMDGETHRVRYIGIDAPEAGMPCASEAAAKNRELVDGKTVRLEKDVSETDRYGRLLRYVYVGDLMVNAEMVRSGYAQAATYPPDVRYQDLFVRLQQEAQKAGLGCWGAAASPSRPPTSRCDPSYPDVCIPPPPPDLDCNDIPHRRFRVLPPDPHRFDNDHDGIGCERG